MAVAKVDRCLKKADLNRIDLLTHVIEDEPNNPFNICALAKDYRITTKTSGQSLFDGSALDNVSTKVKRQY